MYSCMTLRNSLTPISPIDVTLTDTTTRGQGELVSNNNELRCPWCNGYLRRKWTRRHEFKSWTRPIAFHIALIPLGKV